MLNLSVTYKSINTVHIVSKKLNLLNNTVILERFWNYLTLYYTNLLTNLISFSEDILNIIGIYKVYVTLVIAAVLIEIIYSLFSFTIFYITY